MNPAILRYQVIPLIEDRIVGSFVEHTHRDPPAFAVRSGRIVSIIRRDLC